jgi:flagellar motor switch protein FliN/FliY
MTETIEYEQFEQSDDGSPPTPGSASEVDLSRLSDIPMELSVEIGRTHMTVGETLDLCVGSIVTLERLAGETADLLVNGSAIARGEVVVIDEQYGLRITEILDGQQDSELVRPAAAPAAQAAGEGEDEGGQQAGGAASVPAQAADADGSPAGEG